MVGLGYVVMRALQLVIKSTGDVQYYRHAIMNKEYLKVHLERVWCKEPAISILGKRASW